MTSSAVNLLGVREGGREGGWERGREGGWEGGRESDGGNLTLP